NADGSAIHSDRLLGQHPMAERIGYRTGAGNPIRRERARHWRLENPKVLLRDAIESALRHAEVFGQNFFRSMGHPVAEQEGRLLGEVAVVEDKQKLAAFGLESLDRVRDAGREVPQVALADVILEGATILVDGGNPRPALEHVGP